jgi:hypothetical protein
MNAISALLQPDAIYVYAVVPAGGGPVPEAAAILAGSGVGSLKAAGLAALVSTVPRCLFEPNQTRSRAADPGLVAECAEAHHRIVSLAAQIGPCLPLGAGTLFASEASLRAWIEREEAALRKTLELVAHRHEWALALIEDPFAHEAWLEAQDTGLKGLAEAARAASPGTGILLERRLVWAREAARLRHQEAAAALLAERLAAEAFAVRREAGQLGHAWSLLAERDAGVAERLAAIGSELFAGTGLALRVTGPWPPYAFTRAAWQEAVVT